MLTQRPHPADIPAAVGIILGLVGAALIAVSLFGAAPHVEAVTDKPAILVTFEPGALAVCVKYVMDPPTIPSLAEYAPTGCTTFEDRRTTVLDDTLWRYVKNPKTGKPYDADWRVWYQPESDPVLSNEIRVHR